MRTFNYWGRTTGSICWFARGVKGQVGGSIPTGNNPPSMNGRRRVMGWGVLGCRPNTTSLRVAGGMPGKSKRIRRCYIIRVGLTSRSPILRSIDKGIKFILAPKSSNAFPISNVPIVTRIVKLPGSLDFWGNDFWGNDFGIIALHPASSSTVSSKNLIFFVRISFMNFAYVGICSIASTKGILIYSRLKMSMNLANCLSLSFLEGFWGYGRLFNVILTRLIAWVNA